MTLRRQRPYLQTIARNLSSVGGSDFGSVSRRDRRYWSSRARVVVSVLRIVPLFIGRCSKSSPAAFLIGRFTGWPIMIPSRAARSQIVDSNLLDDVGASCSIYFIRSCFRAFIITFTSICSYADVTDFRRASGRAGPHDDYQSSLCVP